MRNVIIASGALCGALAYAPFASAATISILAAADNTLCQDAAGGLSNGKGQHFFVGRTNDSTLRRAVLNFDIASVIPAGSTINSAALTLSMSKTRGALSTITLHRVLASWGEGTSDAAANEGGCIASTAGDATWVHARFATTPWTTIGGDFNPAPSNSLGVNGVGSYTWTSTASAVADVQSWLDTPAANFGWLLRGNETADRNVKRFDSRENPVGGIVPTLLVDYTPGTTTACDLNQIDAVTLGPPVSPAKAADWVYTLDCGASVDTRIDPTFPALGSVAAVNPATGASFGSSASGPARLMLFQRACGCTDVIKLVKNGAGAIRITF